MNAFKTQTRDTSFAGMRVAQVRPQRPAEQVRRTRVRVPLNRFRTTIFQKYTLRAFTERRRVEKSDNVRAPN